jgi:hypothetical protein
VNYNESNRIDVGIGGFLRAPLRVLTVVDYVVRDSFFCGFVVLWLRVFVFVKK